MSPKTVIPAMKLSRVAIAAAPATMTGTMMTRPAMTAISRASRCPPAALGKGRSAPRYALSSEAARPSSRAAMATATASVPTHERAAAGKRIAMSNPSSPTAGAPEGSRPVPGVPRASSMAYPGRAPTRAMRK